MSRASTPRLIAIDRPGGPEFVTELCAIWDAGNAALPLDPRLPPVARQALAASLGVGEPVEPGDALVMATSGSTGTPKGVVLTHDALAAQARAVHRHLAVDRATDRWLAVLPLAHVGGLGVVVRALVDDVPLTVEPHLRPDAMHGTLVSLVPTLLDRLAPEAVERFRWVVLGGASDPVERPANVVRTYGMTESGGGVVYDGVPLDGVAVRVVDGELQLKGPSLLRTYRDGTDPFTPDGWFPTGDLGTVDEAGIVHVQGRRDTLIISGGENVWPEVVEAALAHVPGVRDLAIVGCPDPEWGTRVVAIVVPDGAVTLEALRDAGRATLPGFALPRELRLAEQIPRTALGKIERGRLL